ncbi:MAG: hypothetical protein HY905_08185 [Deltaproteobacteria bacterium]|nr:hypothetical protein [Deltaproteobacteria bacterium]
MPHFRTTLVLATLALGSAVWLAGCRCGRSAPGAVGKAATAMDAIPADVDAVIVIDAEGLRQGSLGEFIYTPWVVRQFEQWGGPQCAALPARLVSKAAFGIRLAAGGQQVEEVFFGADGPTIDDVKACVDEHARRQGLSSSFEEVAGLRDLTDGRGLHVLAAGDHVVARGFPFNDRGVLEQMANTASGKIPALSGNTAFLDLLQRLGGDVTVALSETTELFAGYGRDLDAAVAKSIPPELCATPTEFALLLTMARAQGLGELSGLEQFAKARLAGKEKMCLAELVSQAFGTFGSIRAAGITLTGRADIELGLMLEFVDAVPATEVRGVLADLIYVLQVLPERLDSLERDWPAAYAWLQKQLDIPRLRNMLRNPVFKHITVGGDGTAVDLRIRVEEADVQAAIESTVETLTHLVAKD